MKSLRAAAHLAHMIIGDSADSYRQKKIKQSLRVEMHLKIHKLKRSLPIAGQLIIPVFI